MCFSFLFYEKEELELYSPVEKKVGMKSLIRGDKVRWKASVVD